MSRTAPTPADALPTSPSISRPASFETESDTWVAAHPAYRDQLNSLAGVTYSNAVDSYDSAVASAASAAASLDSANDAAVSASGAEASAAQAATNAGATLWVSGVSYAFNTAVTSPTNFATFRKRTATSVTSIDPISDPTNWYPVSQLKSLRMTRSSNTILREADRGVFIDVVTGSFTQTFDTANLVAGWTCRIGNSGNGEVTITSDGVSNWKMYSNEVRDFYWDGTSLTSIIVQPFAKTWTTTATNNFTKPPGYVGFSGELWNGGNGGNGGGYYASGIGANGGRSATFIVAASKVGATETVTVGSGGSYGIGGTDSGTSGGSGYGGNGGVTSFGALVSTSGVSDQGAYYGGGSDPAVPAKMGGAAGGAGATNGVPAVSGGVSLLAGNGGQGGTYSSGGTGGNGAAGVAPAGGGGGGGAGSGGTGGNGGQGARGEARIRGIV